MAETGRGTVRVHFTKEGLSEGLLETGHPYPGVEWKIDGGVLFMKFIGNDGPRWDFIFGPSKWMSVNLLDD
ncbi:hypothetical protein [Mycolicibacterium sp. HS_4_1]